MSLKLIIGPMFASKTSALINEHDTALKYGHRCLVIKSTSDDRYSIENIRTHNGVEIKALPVHKLQDATTATRNVHAIFIDELHFYEDALEIVPKWVDNGKHIVATTLSGDENRQGFKVVSGLIPHCDQLTLLRASCNQCPNEAIFIKRRPDAGPQLIGGAEIYTVLCRRCYLLG